MPTEIVVLICLSCLVAGLLIANYWHRKEAETSESVFWANVRQPQIIEQRFATLESQKIAVHEYETALKKMREYGNRWLTEKDIFLFIWGNDAANTEADFYRWQYLNIERRKSLMEAFFAQKAKQAEQAKNEAAAAKMWAGGNDDNENLN